MKSQPIQPGSSGASMSNALSNVLLERDRFAGRLTPFRYVSESRAQSQLWIGSGLGRQDGR